MNVLEIQNVTKRFGNLVAVRDVSLNVAKGNCARSSGRTAPARPPSST